MKNKIKVFRVLYFKNISKIHLLNIKIIFFFFFFLKKKKKKKKYFNMFCNKNMPLSKIIFNKYDTDSSGTITATEFKYMAYDLGYYISDNELEIAIKTVDSSGTGAITYDDCK